MKKNTILIIALLISSLSCYSQSQGPFNPMSATYSAAGCLACPGSDWNNFQNISLPDHQYAESGLASYPQCFQATCYYSRILFAFDFGFSIPQGSTILGVSAQVLCMSTAPTDVTDSLVQLYTGSPVGINHASTVNWTPNPMTVGYGDSADTWGYILTPDTVNSTQFGLAVMAVNRNMAGLITTASVDHIEMTIYYSTGTGIQTQTHSSNNFSVYYDASSSNLDVFTGKEKIKNFRIIDDNGKEIYENDFQPASSEITRVRIPHLTNGIYMVLAELDGKLTYHRFIVETKD